MGGVGVMGDAQRQSGRVVREETDFRERSVKRARWRRE